jgi:hypothetical protein
VKGWAGIVGIATTLRVGRSGDRISKRRDFPHSSRPALGPTQPPDTGSVSPGVKRLGRSVEHPRPSGAEVKERVELYIYSHSRPSWPVTGYILLHDNPTTVPLAVIKVTAMLLSGHRLF